MQHEYVYHNQSQICESLDDRLLKGERQNEHGQVVQQQLDETLQYTKVQWLREVEQVSLVHSKLLVEFIQLTKAFQYL